MAFPYLTELSKLHIPHKSPSAIRKCTSVAFFPSGAQQLNAESCLLSSFSCKLLVLSDPCLGPDLLKPQLAAMGSLSCRTFRELNFVLVLRSWHSALFPWKKKEHTPEIITDFPKGLYARGLLGLSCGSIILF